MGSAAAGDELAAARRPAPPDRVDSSRCCAQANSCGGTNSITKDYLTCVSTGPRMPPAHEVAAQARPQRHRDEHQHRVAGGQRHGRLGRRRDPHRVPPADRCVVATRKKISWPVPFETVTSVISPIDPNRACARGFDRATLEGPAVVAAPGQCAVHTDMSPGGRDRTQYQRKEVEWVFHR